MRRLSFWLAITAIFTILVACGTQTESAPAAPEAEALPANSEQAADSPAGKPQFVEFYADW